MEFLVCFELGKTIVIMTLSDHGSFIGFPLPLHVLYEPNRPDLDNKTYLKEDWDYLVNLQRHGQ